MKDNPRVVFDAVYKMLPALRAEVKIGKVKVSTAKLNRMMVEKAASEFEDPARTAAILGLSQ